MMSSVVIVILVSDSVLQYNFFLSYYVSLVLPLLLVTSVLCGRMRPIHLQ